MYLMSRYTELAKYGFLTRSLQTILRLGRPIEDWGNIKSYALLYATHANIYAFCDYSCMLFIALCAIVLVFGVANYPMSMW